MSVVSGTVAGIRSYNFSAPNSSFIASGGSSSSALIADVRFDVTTQTVPPATPTQVLFDTTYVLDPQYLSYNPLTGVFTAAANFSGQISIQLGLFTPTLGLGSIILSKNGVRVIETSVAVYQLSPFSHITPSPFCMSFAPGDTVSVTLNLQQGADIQPGLSSGPSTFIQILKY